MASPKNIKDVQRLTGRVAALSRFISKSAEKCLHFFKVLKGAKDFRWTEQCQHAFDDLKRYMESPPLITRPKQGEELFLYLAVSESAVSSVLVREVEGKHRPVYYVSKALNDAETRYTLIEKVAYAVVISARKLRPYFQAHTIKILTNHPIRQILQKPDVSGRLVKWSVELGEFDIYYQPRTSIKAQILADFLVECNPEPIPPKEQTTGTWTLFVDGSSSAKKSGAGLILVSPDGWTLQYALRFGFRASNNVSEYEALITGLTMARHLEVKRIKVFSDSQLVVNQVKGEFEAREPTMIKYLAKVKEVISVFEQLDIRQIPREENTRADALSKLAASEVPELNRTVYIEVMERPSIDDQSAQVNQTQVEPSWIDPIVSWVKDGQLPEDAKEARKVKYRATRYELINGVLFKRSYTLPYLRCLRPSEANYALREVHEGICGNHSGGRALALKILRHGYYWPTLQQDAADFVRKCDRCQRYSHTTHQPASPLTPISSPWPFAQWGMDFLGPFPPATGQRKFLIVAIDYFTKWVEAEALAKITEQNTQNFVWKSIICRFGLPRILVTDNGKQFDCAAFRNFCKELHIENRFTSVAYPQANGQAEVTNRTILQSLKTRLEGVKGLWADELPGVLWAYRTTKRSPTGESPYSLTFGAEAVIPIEIGLPSYRVISFNEQDNASRRLDLDLVEESREQAQLRMAAYQQRVARYYNSRVKGRSFREGDLVLRKQSVSDPEANKGKLAPTWEGPYIVKKVVGPGTYLLATLGGRDIPRTWNAGNLRVYYQ